MNQKLLLFGIVLLVLVGAGSYFLGTKKSQPSPIPTSNLPSESSSNKYQDQYFSVIVPQVFDYNTLNVDHNIPDGIEMVTFQANKNSQLPELRIDVEDADILNNYNHYYPEKAITVNGQSAIRAEIVSRGTIQPTVFVTYNGKRYIISVSIDDSDANLKPLPEEKFKPANDLLNQILSTFKFTN